MFRDPALGFVMLISGLVVLALLGRVEDADIAAEPWAGAAFAPAGSPLWPGALKTYATRISIENFPELNTVVEDMRARGGAGTIKQFGLDKAERLVAIDAPDATLEELLSWGRIPARGEAEVLAGVMTRLDTFENGGRSYEVVGGIRRGVAGLHFAYVFPYDESSKLVNRDWTAGWFDQNGLKRLQDVDQDSDLAANQHLIAGMHPSDSGRAWGVIAALILIVVGGAVIQVRLFAAFSKHHTGILRPGLEAIHRGRIGLVLLHLGGFGVFFGAMAAGLTHPVWQLYMQDFVAAEFTDGKLGYVGKAYSDGHIPLAALATFANNYLVQTLGLTVAPSLVIPFFGVFKTAATFLVTGFVLAPVWAETASMYVFHSITMALELEAYLLATYGACLYGLSLFRSARANDWNTALGGLATIGSLAVLSGILLAVAALYEAATLILFV